MQTVARRVRARTAAPNAFDSYDDALAAAGTSGYDSDAIARGTIGEFRDEAARSRAALPFADGRTMRQLAAVWRVRHECDGKALNVLDLGGQVGVHYQRLRVHLPDDAFETWDVCETPALVGLAQAQCTEPRLRFVAGLQAAAAADYDLAFASGGDLQLREPRVIRDALGTRASGCCSTVCRSVRSRETA